MKYDLEALLKIAGKLAEEDFSGHLTIMKFTTNWRVGYGTPSDDGHTRDFIGCLTEGKTLYEALVNFVIDELFKKLECSRGLGSEVVPYPLERFLNVISY